MLSSSSASAWINPSLFKADAAAVKPSYKVEETEPEATEPENTTGGSIGGEEETTAAATEANTDANTAADTTETKEGCGSTIGFAAASMVALAAGFVVTVKRKKED